MTGSPPRSYQTIQMPEGQERNRRRRPSYLANSVHSIQYLNAPHANINSIEHFASSFTRAQSFLAIEPPGELNRARSFFVDEDIPSSPSTATGVVATSVPRRPSSFSSRYFEEHGQAFDDEAGSEYSRDDDERSEYSNLLDHHRDTIGSLVPTPIIGSYKAGYSSHTSRRPSYVVPPPEGSILLQEGEAIAPGTETEPVIIRQVEDPDGKIITIVAGQSTAPQTVFNSVNVLIGVGLLSLPLGFKYSGWLLGLSMLLGAALATFYSAKLLAKCLDTDHTLVTYADVAYAAFGHRARLLVSLLFTFELMGAGVSLVVLFADSLNALFPQFSSNDYKILAFILLTPPCFLPLRILSFSSIIGILCTFSLVLIVMFDGLYKTTSPGSLIQPMTTWLLPQKWEAFPLSIGIIMAPWGGHAVFPNIYRDMRHPQKYASCLVTTYQITFLTDVSMGILGFLMFGNLISEEVTKNILISKGYPKALNYVITALIACVPLAKTPLNARPIVSTIDILTGLDDVSMEFSRTDSFHSLTKKVLKALVRIVVVLSFVGLAVVFPQFDRIVALVGATLCTTICMILPLCFYLKIYKGHIPEWELILDYSLLVIFTIVMLVGTVWR